MRQEASIQYAGEVGFSYRSNWEINEAMSVIERYRAYIVSLETKIPLLLSLATAFSDGPNDCV